MEKEAKKATKERNQVTPEICEQVKLLRTAGINQTQIGKIIRLDPSRISRIERAGFDFETYKVNDRKERLEQLEKKLKAVETPEQVEGQIRMELTPETPEMSDQTKMMRFQAAQVDKILMKLDKLNDTMCMILRAVRKE